MICLLILSLSKYSKQLGVNFTIKGHNEKKLKDQSEKNNTALVYSVQ